MENNLLWLYFYKTKEEYDANKYFWARLVKTTDEASTSVLNALNEGALFTKINRCTAYTDYEITLYTGEIDPPKIIAVLDDFEKEVNTTYLTADKFILSEDFKSTLLELLNKEEQTDTVKNCIKAINSIKKG